MTDAEKILILAIPFFVLSMVVEGVALARGAKGRPYEPRDTAASLAMGLGYLAIATVWKAVDLSVLSSFWHQRIGDWGNGPLAWAVVILGWDFFYYWYHRAGHEIRILWAAHVNHHSSQRYNLSTALRQTWSPFASVLFFIPLAVLGFSPEQILTAGALNLLYQFWIHTETIGRLGPLEWVLNTPSHHRVHHGANVQYLDRNYGGILILWDRLFGTFEPEVEAARYGLTKNIEGHNPLWIAAHEYVAIARDLWDASGWRDRVAFALRPPGWRPNRPLQGA